MKDDSQVSTSRLEDGAVHWDGDTEGDTDGGGGGREFGSRLIKTLPCLWAVRRRCSNESRKRKSGT